MDHITITISNPRAVDGVVTHVNSQNRERPGDHVAPEDYLLREVMFLALGLADLHGVGVVTGLELVRALTTDEYVGIVSAAQGSEEIAGLIERLTRVPTIAKDDPRLVTGLATLVQAGLLAPHRPAEIMSWPRPTVEPPASIDAPL